MYNMETNNIENTDATSMETGKQSTWSKLKSGLKKFNEKATSKLKESFKKEQYGDVHAISLFSAVLARLAYFNDNLFLEKYCAIMGPVFNTEFMSAINNVPPDNLQQLLDDQTLFGLTKPECGFSSYEYNGKKFIDFLGMKMPQNVNILNGDMSEEPSGLDEAKKPTAEDVKYISLGWSNYGEVFIVADKRMKNTIFLLFRGTNSAKTAALYTKPTSLVPLTTCKDSNDKAETFLYGIFKPTAELIHTIIESIRYLATDFLGATTPNSVKIYTTGHSLGGAMCTNFAYLWMGIKKTPPYTEAPYNVIADQIICISLGAPRCMGSNVSHKFCEFVKSHTILYLRIVTKGDPVPDVPLKIAGFTHPCSGTDDRSFRSEIYEKCLPSLKMRSTTSSKRIPIPVVDYNTPLGCQNDDSLFAVKNPLSHTIYIYILYTYAVDISTFAKGLNPLGETKEVQRSPAGHTMCRIIVGQKDNYKVVFFDVAESRLIAYTGEDVKLSDVLKNEKTIPVLAEEPGENLPSYEEALKMSSKMPPFSNSPVVPMLNYEAAAAAGGGVKFGGEIHEDIGVTGKVFDKIIAAALPIEGDTKCPTNIQNLYSEPFSGPGAPPLFCVGKVLRGGKTRKRNTKKRKTKHCTKKQMIKP